MDLDRLEVERCLIALHEEVSAKDFVRWRTANPSYMNPSSSMDDDVAILRSVLAEKERDLELAARIGQSLLSKNRVLQLNHDELEQLFAVAQEELTQLRHELSINKELLRRCLLETSDGDADPELGSEAERAAGKQIQSLQRRIRLLEDENHRLRLEAKELSAESAEFATKDTEVIHACIQELADAKAQLLQLTEAIQRKSEENARMQEEVAALLKQMTQLQSRLQQTTSENDDLKTSVSDHKDVQQQLIRELLDVQAKYDRLRAVANELEDEIRMLKQNSSYVQSWAESSFSSEPLAAELNMSIMSAFNSASLSDDEQEQDGNAYKQIMDTVAVANMDRRFAKVAIADQPRRANRTSATSGTPSPRSSSTASATVSPRRPPRHRNESIERRIMGSYFGSDRWGSSDDQGSTTSADESGFERSVRGVSHVESYRYCNTPDSALSMGAESLRTGSGSGSIQADLTKLMLVKPFENSETLAKWANLAKPSFGGALGVPDGIVTKGQNVGRSGSASLCRIDESPTVDKPKSLPSIFKERTNNVPVFPSAAHRHSPNSVFSVGELLKTKGISSNPVFPSVERREEAARLSDILKENIAENAESSHIIRIESPSPDGGKTRSRGRSRSCSSSLSSASRSPSPPSILDGTGVICPASSVQSFIRSPLIPSLSLARKSFSMMHEKFLSQ